MKNRLPLRCWVDAGFGAASAALLALTLVWPDWIERRLGLAPDDGDGSVEWGWVVALAVATVVLFADAGRLWRRTVRASAASKQSAKPASAGS
jgi:hypothetical protein